MSGVLPMSQEGVGPGKIARDDQQVQLQLVLRAVVWSQRHTTSRHMPQHTRDVSQLPALDRAQAIHINSLQSTQLGTLKRQAGLLGCFSQNLTLASVVRNAAQSVGLDMCNTD